MTKNPDFFKKKSRHPRGESREEGLGIPWPYCYDRLLSTKIDKTLQLEKSIDLQTREEGKKTMNAPSPPSPQPGKGLKSKTFVYLTPIEKAACCKS